MTLFDHYHKSLAPILWLYNKQAREQLTLISETIAHVDECPKRVLTDSQAKILPKSADRLRTARNGP